MKRRFVNLLGIAFGVLMFCFGFGLIIVSLMAEPESESIKGSASAQPIVVLTPIPTQTPRAGNAGTVSLPTLVPTPKPALPVRFQIKSIGLEAPVEMMAGKVYSSFFDQRPAEYRWEVPNYYAVGLEYQAQDKYLVFNGHSVSLGQSKDKAGEWEDVFRKLSEIKPGDMLVLNFSDGSTRQYQAQAKGVLLPDKIREALTNLPSGSVLAYTCVGPWACTVYKDGKCQGAYLKNRGYVVFVPVK